MVLSVSYELETFFISVFIAAASGILSSLIKGFMSRVPQKAVKDILLWIFVTLAAFFLWQKFLGGLVRWYVVLGFFLTFFIYSNTLDKYLFKLFSFVAERIYDFLHLNYKILLTVSGFLCKIISVYIVGFCKKFYRKVRNL